MLSKELLSKVKQIEITTSRLVTDVFAGEYHSVFKGQGIEFDEVREYQIGDDIRTIDWNVTARTGRAHVKKFVEERELTVMIMVDASASHRFSSVNELKSQLAAEISALLAFSAIRNNDKVGLIIFTDRIEKFIPPRKGKRHVLRIIREVLYFEPKGTTTDLGHALEYLQRVMTRRTITFLISDFFPSTAQHSQAPEQLRKIMKIVNKRHDLIAIALSDPKEKELTDSGLLVIQDAETGNIRHVDSSSAEFRKFYKEKNVMRLMARQQLFRSIDVDHIDLSTDISFADAMVKFFLKRKSRH